MKNVIIYHDKCADGAVAAAIAYEALSKNSPTVVYPYYYNKAVGDWAQPDCNVFIVDFSFSEQTLLDLEKTVNKVVLLDHHKTASENLKQYKAKCDCAGSGCKVFLNIDQAKSGARLAWEYFYPNVPAPKLVRAIETRDLWVWTEPNAKQLLAYFDSVCADIYSNNNAQEVISQKLRNLIHLSDQDWQAYEQEGQIYLNKLAQAVSSINTFSMDLVLNGVLGRACNNSYLDAKNDLGAMLASVHNTFGLVWYVGDGVVKCSLRSSKGFDVESLAKKYGGGGHETSASFTLTIDQLPSLLAGLL